MKSYKEIVKESVKGGYGEYEAAYDAVNEFLDGLVRGGFINDIVKETRKMEDIIDELADGLVDIWSKRKKEWKEESEKEPK